MVKGHGNTPVGHGAARVVLGDPDELFLRVGVGEGVEKSDGSIEQDLRGRRTRDGKRHFAEFLWRGMLMLLLR